MAEVITIPSTQKFSASRCKVDLGDHIRRYDQDVSCIRLVCLPENLKRVELHIGPDCVRSFHGAELSEGVDLMQVMKCELLPASKCHGHIVALWFFYEGPASTLCTPLETLRVYRTSTAHGNEPVYSNKIPVDTNKVDTCLVQLWKPSCQTTQWVTPQVDITVVPAEEKEDDGKVRVPFWDALAEVKVSWTPADQEVKVLSASGDVLPESALGMRLYTWHHMVFEDGRCSVEKETCVSAECGMNIL